MRQHRVCIYSPLKFKSLNPPIWPDRHLNLMASFPAPSPSSQQFHWNHAVSVVLGVNIVANTQAHSSTKYFTKGWKFGDILMHKWYILYHICGRVVHSFSLQLGKLKIGRYEKCIEYIYRIHLSVINKYLMKHTFHTWACATGIMLEKTHTTGI